MTSENQLAPGAPMSRLRRAAAAQARAALRLAEEANAARRDAAAMVREADAWSLLADQLSLTPVEELKLSPAVHQVLRNNGAVSIGDLILLWGQLPLARFESLPKMTYRRRRSVEYAIYALFRSKIGSPPEAWKRRYEDSPYGRIFIYCAGDEEDWIDT